MTKKKVLIVEDEISVSDLLVFLVEKDGHKAFTAYDGEEAVKCVISYKPDLILLDIMLPKMDGYSVHKRLQADEKTANIPIIIVTAKTGMQDLFGLEKNIVAYIEKPFDPKILRAKVAGVLK
ncbi:MAG: response regulator [Elusimicrobia bacterium]|nr:response regulator [Elusimicrobiota bacterium]